MKDKKYRYRCACPQPAPLTNTTVINFEATCRVCYQSWPANLHKLEELDWKIVELEAQKPDWLVLESEISRLKVMAELHVDIKTELQARLKEFAECIVNMDTLGCSCGFDMRNCPQHRKCATKIKEAREMLK